MLFGLVLRLCYFLILCLKEVDQNVIILVKLVFLSGCHCAIQIDADSTEHIFDHSGANFTNLKALFSVLLLAIKVNLLYDGLASG